MVFQNKSRNPQTALITMNLYINDTYIHLLRPDEEYEGPTPDQTLSTLSQILPHNLAGTVLLTNATIKDLNSIINWIEFKKLGKLRTVVCQTSDYKASKQSIKNQFRIIKAAGGLVRKGDQFLMMHRLGKWDLPKGKLDKGEKTRDAAIREVNEECNIEVELVSKLCTTWHTYIQEGRRILKKTTWYTMDCVDDSEMEPQYVENIDELKWMNLEECIERLKDSYRSIRGVFSAYSKEKENQSLIN